MNDFIIYQHIDSTNKEAQRLLMQGPVPNGTTVFALDQSSGQGQYGRMWKSQPGHHLAMSIIYRPDGYDTSAIPTIGMKVSLGIISALKRLDPTIQAQIKWPNDIYVGSQKLSGILIENALTGTRVLHSIIGIGMNMNESSFPPDIPNPVSLFMLTGQNYDLMKMAQDIRATVIQILNEPDDGWKAAYDAHIYGLGETHMFEFKGNEIPAQIMGVNLDGKILLQTAHDKSLACFSHEIKWVSPIKTSRM